MRTIGQIIEAVEEQQPVTDEELRLAVVALWHKLQIEIGFEPETRVPKLWDFMRSEPGKYLGPRWTPGTVENTQGRAMSKKIMEIASKRAKKAHHPKPKE